MQRLRCAAALSVLLASWPALSWAHPTPEDAAPRPDEPEDLEELESLDSLDALDGADDADATSFTWITHARTFSLFGATITRVDGEVEVGDLALVVERVRPVLTLSVGDWLRAEAAYDIIPLVGTNQNVGAFAVQNVGLNALRLLDFNALLYRPKSDGWLVQHNLDRFNVRLGTVGREVQIGRQAFNHGSARMFPATDIFAPFGPATLDTEFKRGVDALRATLGLTQNHALEAYVIAHEPDFVGELDGGEFTPSQWMYLVRWSGVFPQLFDISMYAGSSYAQPTVGLDLSAALGGAAVYAESMARLACAEDQDTSVQASAGVDYQWDFGLTSIAEVYYSSLGGRPPYERALGDPSLARRVGELNYLGQWYVGVSAAYSWELLSAGVGYIQNMRDGSLLVTANLGYDFAENVAVGLGGIVPFGQRLTLDSPPSAQPSEPPMAPTPEVRSEFGLFPLLLSADIRLTF